MVAGGGEQRSVRERERTVMEERERKWQIKWVFLVFKNIFYEITILPLRFLNRNFHTVIPI